MQRYEVISTLNVNTGEVGLDPSQAQRRRGKLKKLKKSGVYEVIKPTQFKRGEVISLAAASKSQLSAGVLRRLDDNADELAELTGKGRK